MKNKFKGLCNNFGKRGHSRKLLWNLDTNKDSRPENWEYISSKEDKKLRCKFCKKDNHTEDKCFYKKEHE